MRLLCRSLLLLWAFLAITEAAGTPRRRLLTNLHHRTRQHFGNNIGTDIDDQNSALLQDNNEAWSLSRTVSKSTVAGRTSPAGAAIAGVATAAVAAPGTPLVSDAAVELHPEGKQPSADVPDPQGVYPPFMSQQSIYGFHKENKAARETSGGLYSMTDWDPSRQPAGLRPGFTSPYASSLAVDPFETCEDHDGQCIECFDGTTNYHEGADCPPHTSGSPCHTDGYVGIFESGYCGKIGTMCCVRPNADFCQSVGGKCVKYDPSLKAEEVDNKQCRISVANKYANPGFFKKDMCQGKEGYACCVPVNDNLCAAIGGRCSDCLYKNDDGSCFQTAPGANMDYKSTPGSVCPVQRPSGLVVGGQYVAGLCPSFRGMMCCSEHPDADPLAYNPLINTNGGYVVNSLDSPKCKEAGGQCVRCPKTIGGFCAPFTKGTQCEQQIGGGRTRGGTFMDGLCDGMHGVMCCVSSLAGGTPADQCQAAGGFCQPCTRMLAGVCLISDNSPCEMILPGQPPQPGQFKKGLCARIGTMCCISNTGNAAFPNAHIGNQIGGPGVVSGAHPAGDTVGIQEASDAVPHDFAYGVTQVAETQMQNFSAGQASATPLSYGPPQQRPEQPSQDQQQAWQPQPSSAQSGFVEQEQEVSSPQDAAVGKAEMQSPSAAQPGQPQVAPQLAGAATNAQPTSLPVQAQPTQPQPTQLQATAAQTEAPATQPQATQPQATQPQATQPQATQPQATQANPSQPTAQPTTTQPEASPTQPTTTQSESTASQEQPTQSNTTQSNTTQSTTTQPQTTQPQATATQPEVALTQPQASQPQPNQQEAAPTQTATTQLTTTQPQPTHPQSEATSSQPQPAQPQQTQPQVITTQLDATPSQPQSSQPEAAPTQPQPTQAPPTQPQPSQATTTQAATSQATTTQPEASATQPEITPIQPTTAQPTTSQLTTTQPESTPSQAQPTQSNTTQSTITQPQATATQPEAQPTQAQTTQSNTTQSNTTQSTITQPQATATQPEAQPTQAQSPQVQPTQAGTAQSVREGSAQSSVAPVHDATQPYKIVPEEPVEKFRQVKDSSYVSSTQTAVTTPVTSTQMPPPPANPHDRGCMKAGGFCQECDNLSIFGTCMHTWLPCQMKLNVADVPTPGRYVKDLCWGPGVMCCVSDVPHPGQPFAGLSHLTTDTVDATACTDHDGVCTECPSNFFDSNTGKKMCSPNMPGHPCRADGFIGYFEAGLCPGDKMCCVRPNDDMCQSMGGVCTKCESVDENGHCTSDIPGSVCRVNFIGGQQKWGKMRPQQCNNKKGFMCCIPQNDLQCEGMGGRCTNCPVKNQDGSCSTNLIGNPCPFRRSSVTQVVSGSFIQGLCPNIPGFMCCSDDPYYNPNTFFPNPFARPIYVGVGT